MEKDNKLDQIHRLFLLRQVKELIGYLPIQLVPIVTRHMKMINPMIRLVLVEFYGRFISIKLYDTSAILLT
jgi:hypothetical protein